MQRKIIHCDCDCFYAAIEMRDRPMLRERPLAIGGPLSGRGVVATCNYPARAYGVHSAMPMVTARRLCPDLVVLPPDMDKYRAAARQIFSIYRQYSTAVEPLSLDEAYLDVSAAPHAGGSATRMAEAIRAEVRAAVGITVSAGVAPNKFLAKIASDWNKPDGLFVIRPEAVDAFVAALPVEKLFGVGRVTARRLHALGLRTCAQVRSWPLPRLIEQFGQMGAHLYALAHGQDERPVCADAPRRSVSVETTFARDMPDLAACQIELPVLIAALQTRLERAGGGRVEKLFVKLRFASFARTTAECAAPAIDAGALARLLAVACARRHEPVRLLGVGVRLGEAPAGQLALFAEEDVAIPAADKKTGDA